MRKRVLVALGVLLGSLSLAVAPARAQLTFDSTADNPLPDLSYGLHGTAAGCPASTAPRPCSSLYHTAPPKLTACRLRHNRAGIRLEGRMISQYPKRPRDGARNP